MSRFFKLTAVAALFLTGLVACSSSPVSSTLTLDESAAAGLEPLPDDVDTTKTGGRDEAAPESIPAHGSDPKPAPVER